MVFIVPLGQERQVGYCRVRLLGGGPSLEFSFSYFSFSFDYLPPRTNVAPLLGFADKEQMTPRLSLVNVQALNFLLKIGRAHV